MSRITHSDLSDYTCVARNGEGRIHHTVRVVIAGTVQYSTVQYSKGVIQYSLIGSTRQFIRSFKVVAGYVGGEPAIE